MPTILLLVFLAGYAVIAMEHRLRINKAAPALLTGMLVWTLLIVRHDDFGLQWGAEGSVHHLHEHLADVAGIAFFLLGAMTVVELMDAHGGFEVVTDRIRTRSRSGLLWLSGAITFVLSAILDNLTTAIVMAAVLRRLVADAEDLRLYCAAVVLAANAGGAWSPIGDVTTIMLWIGGQISAEKVVGTVLLPSLVCFLLPTFWLARSLRGPLRQASSEVAVTAMPVTRRQRTVVFALGLLTLLGVPAFKQFTHLPPFMGVMFGLAILWCYTEFIHAGKLEQRGQLQVTAILRRVDHASILFFLGILIAVAGLETAGLLARAASWLDQALPDIYAVGGLIGVLSAVVDNVPLVAAAQGMYSLATYPRDHTFWQLLAYCAGTGGSLLIIGSAAGVAVMSIVHIDFVWYVRRMTLPAALGYGGGLLTFWLLWA